MNYKTFSIFSTIIVIILSKILSVKMAKKSKDGENIVPVVGINLLLWLIVVIIV